MANDMQDQVFLLTVVLMLLVVFVFIWVASSSQTSTDEPYSEIQTKAYSKRFILFTTMLVAGIVITIATTQSLPYSATRGAVLDKDTQVINVVGKQWYWELSQDSAEAGKPVLFNVTSGDVNHGLGIYDSNLQLLGQTQAMPGYENKLKYLFEEPGEYKLMCMEYCGLAHHVMIASFFVNAPEDSQ